MDLRRYLFEKNMTRKAFAELVGYTPNYISMICNNRIAIYKPAAMRIKEMTNGVVDYTERAVP